MNLRDAQVALWGNAGAWAYDTWHEYNWQWFDGELVYAGIVWGLTPHGGSLGFCEGSGRITLHRALVEPQGALPWGWPAARFTDRLAGDALIHEMIHALLSMRGVMRDDRGGHHNTLEWCEEIVRLSPLVTGRCVRAEPIRPRRIEGKVTRAARETFLARGQIATWPRSIRKDAETYYEGGNRLSFSAPA